MSWCMITVTKLNTLEILSYQNVIYRHAYLEKYIFQFDYSEMDQKVKFCPMDYRISEYTIRDAEIDFSWN